MRTRPRLAFATGVLLSLIVMIGTAQAQAHRWTSQETGVLASLALRKLAPAPADPSNAVEQKAPAIALGKRLFADTRFSSNGAVSCASCHAPDKQFQDGLPVSRGVGVGGRRAMPIVGTAYSPWLFWDGRKDSLWSQALGPLEDAVEHGGNRTNFARLMATHYRSEYEAVFGPMPDLAGLPADASPNGSDAQKSAWQSMSAVQRTHVNRVFANMGKAIAAFEKTLAFGPSRFDRYVEATLANDASARQLLTPQEVNGLRLFIGKGQCVTCHNGPLLTDQAFHNTGVPPRVAARPDRGRAAAIPRVLRDEFNCLGPFSDAKPDACQELAYMVQDEASMEGAFKTPGLRNVAMRAPYMHAGQFADLEAVIAHYVKSPKAAVGHSELAHGNTGHAERKPIQLSDAQAQDLVAFLRTLTGPITEGPRAASL
jgi:cytochrome c peroxidase